jgi:hypothetical protein
MFSHGDKGNISLGIDIGRAIVDAWADTIGIVIGEEHLKRSLPGIANPFVIGVNLHAVGNGSTAGGYQFTHPFYFYHTEETGTVRFNPFIVTEGWDFIYFIFMNHFKDGFARGGNHFFSVYRRFNLGH